jgi:hypothetical protein
VSEKLDLLPSAGETMEALIILDLLERKKFTHWNEVCSQSPQTQ